MYYNRFRRGQSGARRIRSFDPSSVINTPQRYEKTPEYAITHEFGDFELTRSLKEISWKKDIKLLPYSGSGNYSSS